MRKVTARYQGGLVEVTVKLSDLVVYVHRHLWDAQWLPVLLAMGADVVMIQPGEEAPE